ncbi:MAG TPA: hypothetical protein VKD46_09105 [bacterium]|nr:hypothetical protein [bacterium]
MSGSLSATWLSTRLGRDPQAIDALRREGRLLGMRIGDHFEYPSWQFDPAGNVLPEVPRLIAASRAAGVTDDRLAALLKTRSGLGSDRRLSDSLVEGNLDHVLSVVLSAPRSV